jgi:hypothetical protein
MSVRIADSAETHAFGLTLLGIWPNLTGGLFTRSFSNKMSKYVKKRLTHLITLSLMP